MQNKDILGKLKWTMIVLVCWSAAVCGIIEKGKGVKLTFQDRWIIMDYHNTLRREMNASNMKELSWDREAARGARIWSRRCNYDRHRHDGYSQNMFYNAKTTEPTNEILLDALNSWGKEKDQYIPRQECGKSKKCEYLRIITADVQSVGCAVAKCPVLHMGKIRRESKVNFVVCFYTPYIDLSHDAPYMMGEPCTHCPTGFSCRNKMCSPPILPFMNFTFESAYDLSVKEPTRNHINRQPNTPDITNIVLPHEPTIRIGLSANHIPGANSVNPAPQHEIKLDNRPVSELRKNRKQRTFNKRPLERNRNINSRNKLQAFTSTERGRNRVKRQAPSRYDPYAVQRARHMAERRRQQREREEKLRERHEAQARYEREKRIREAQQRAERERRERERRERERRERTSRRRTTQDTTRRPTRYTTRRQTRYSTRRSNVGNLVLSRGGGKLTRNEEIYFLQMHNTIRQSGLPKLELDPYLGRWARYVIRCETEYPGPIYTFTNFGKVRYDRPVYEVVYDWSSEGSDTFQDLETGCRTPYDRSTCNHNTIMKNASIREIGCAALDCGAYRNIVCIYK